MFGLIKKIFIGLLTSIVNVFNHTKCVSKMNQKCMTQPTLINLHPFAKLDRCVEVVILLMTYQSRILLLSM